MRRRRRSEKQAGRFLPAGGTRRLNGRTPAGNGLGNAFIGCPQGCPLGKKRRVVLIRGCQGVRQRLGVSGGAKAQGQTRDRRNSNTRLHL